MCVFDKAKTLDNKDGSVVKFIFALSLNLYSTILYPIASTVIIAGFPFIHRSYQGSFLQYVLDAMNSISGILLILIMIYSQKLFKLCIPSKEIPWSCPNMREDIFPFLAHIYMISISNLDITGNLKTALVVVATLAWVVICYMRISHINYFSSRIANLVLFFDFLVLLILT